MLFLVLVPGFAHAIIRNGVLAFFVSVPLGVLVLCGRMIYLEDSEPRPDFDIIFSIACMLWAMILTVAYAACFVGAYVVRRIFSRFVHSYDRP